MALKHQHLPCSIPPMLHSCSSRPHFLVYLHSKTPKLAPLSAASPNSSSTSSNAIFLPFLEEEERRQQQPQQQQQNQHQQEKDTEEPNDPMIRFFKSHSTTKDPPIQGKPAFRPNRRSVWRLAPSFAHVSEEEDDEAETEHDARKQFAETKQRLGLQSPDGVVAEILQIARNLPENTTLGECLGGFEKRVGENDCVNALKLMGEEGLMISSLYFFEWMGLQEPSLVTGKACTVFFPVLGRNGMGDKLMTFFRNLPHTKEFWDVRVYNAAMSGLLASRRYDDAWKVSEVMETNNVRPDHVTGSIMITLMTKSGRSAKDAWEYFKRMDRKGISWGPEVLGALVKSFCEEGLKAEALIIQTEMAKKGISSNAIVYNTLMDAYVKANQVEEAEGLFAEMKAKGLKPTAYTYSILMNAYSKRMQPDIVENLLLEMKDAGLEPNAQSYTTLISAYGKQKAMSDMAADAFLRMKKAGIKPTPHSYTALINAYSVSGWHEKAYDVFENMRKEGIKPAIETYTALLDVFRRVGDTQTLMKIWKLMLSEKIEGTRMTFNTLVDGFAKQGHYIEARDVISEFGKMGLQPTVMTYNMLMNAYARGGQESKLPQLLKEMANLNLKPDSYTYSTMIYAYVRVRDFKRAFFYHKKMVQSGQVPEARQYEKLRAILDVKAAKKNKKDKKAILGIINSKMGMLRAKKKTKKDEFWKTKKRYGRTPNSAPKEQR